MNKALSITYFETEGRQHLHDVVRIAKRVLKKRPDLRNLKIVIFTAFGEGPALAYTRLQEFDPKIIAVTFPPSFVVKMGDKTISPSIHPKIRAFFDGVGIPILTSRLPFDPIDGADTETSVLQAISKTLQVFGGSFSLCIQAVIQACDMGALEVGEQVIAMTGDCAAVMTASSSDRFLSPEAGLCVNEILCKPRNFTISRHGRKVLPDKSGELFESDRQQIRGSAQQSQLPGCEEAK